MRENNYDVYFNGHEHLLQYANTPANGEVEFRNQIMNLRNKNKNYKHSFGSKYQEKLYN
jgi:hypothetical protein